MRNIFFLFSRRGVFALILLLACSVVCAQAPQADFSASVTSGCGPLSVRFTDISSGTPKFWNWDFGNGQFSNQQNPTTAYTTPGTYSVTLVVRNESGADGETKTGLITVFPSPKASFTADATIVCLGSSIRFSDRSTDPGGTIIAWDWQFGDGTSSSAQHPTKVYTENGFQTVSLTVTSSTGCKNTASLGRFIRVLSGIENAFSFTIDSLCRAPFTVRFSNETAGPGTLSYTWNLGNGSSSTDKNPVAVYSVAGTYPVRLTTVSQYGCRNVLDTTITITGATPAIRMPAIACLGVPVNFENSSTPTFKTSTWEFGDGGTATGTPVTYTYTTTGTFPVKLITDFGFCKDSITRNINVPPLPTVDFSSPNNKSCKAPFAVSFTALAPGATAWLWDFGDGSTSSDANPTHTFTTNGSYKVTLTVTDAAGCSNTISKPDFVQISPTVVSTTGIPGRGCVPYTYTPTPNYTSILPATGFLWDFGDGTTSTARLPSHVYTQVGTYTVKLIVTTTGGCQNEITVPNAVHVGTPPAPDFTSDRTESCVQNNVRFTDLTLVADEWLWNFGDGTFSSDKNPVHSYTDTGKFTVSLRAFNNGCGVTVTKTEYIYVKPPLANFDAVFSCNNIRNVTFTNSSKVNTSETPLTWLWSFGDPANTTASGQNASFIYPAMATYTVSLEVTNGVCTHKVTKPIKVFSEPADISVSKAAVCRNERFTISAINSDPAIISTYTWSIDNGPAFVGPRNFDTSFSNNGNHSIRLTITDIHGCLETQTINNIVQSSGPLAAFTTSVPDGCVNVPLTFTDATTSATGITNRDWFFGDGGSLISAAATVVHPYAAGGVFRPYLAVTDNMGCKDTARATPALAIHAPKAGFSATDTVFCPGAPILFTDTSSGSQLSHFWTFGDGQGSTVANPTNTYKGPDAQYDVFLKITDSYGCKDSVLKTNYIRISKPIPAFSVSDSVLICPPSEIHFTSESSNYTRLLWDFGNGNISTHETPNQFFNSYGDFPVKLYAFAVGGCADSIVRVMRIQNPFTTRMNYAPINACNELTVDFNLTPSVNLPFTFSFGDGATDKSQALTFSHHYKFPNFYAPMISYTDNQGCTVNVGGPTTIRIMGVAPVFSPDKKTFCDQGTVYFTNFTFPVKDPIASYVWDFKDGTTATDHDPIHTFTTPGTYPVELSVTTESGCTDTYSDTIRIYRTPQPSITTPLGVCVLDPLTISGILNPADTAITWKGSVSNGTALNGQNNQIVFTTPGSYTATLTATNLMGCSGTPATTAITVFPLPEINVPDEVRFPVRTSIPIPVTYSPNVNTWTWTPAENLSCTDCAVPVANPIFAKTYNVKVSDVNGCKSEKTIRLITICNNLNFFLPNTFSPNNDGNNDVFYPRGNGIERIESMRIFNRLGQLVFERRNFSANDPTFGWNGTHNGKPAGADTYVYVVELICENAIIVPYKGNVTLIR